MTVKWVSFVGLGLVCAGAVLMAQSHHESSAPPDNDAIVRGLLAGNERFVAGQCRHPHSDGVRRSEICSGQHPVAAVLSCADSRVPPELVFDQGLGDLFVIRLAGNIPDDAAMGSLEYATEHLGVHVAMVLGHKRCGAVEAAVKGGDAPGHIRMLVEAIMPAVVASKTLPGDLLDNAVRTNVSMASQRLRAAAPILSEMVKGKKLKIVGAYYDLDSGKVVVLP